MHKKHSAILDNLPTNYGERCLSSGSRKEIWSCDNCEACRAGDNNAVRAAAAMDDQEIAVCVLTADDTDMGIVRIEHQIARLCVAPCNVGAIAVLRRRAAAASGIVAAIRRVVECPIDES